MRRDRLLRALIGERFVVTLRGGESFDGLLISADAKTLRLVNSFIVGENLREVVDGDLFVPRAEVVYMQRPGAQA